MLLRCQLQDRIACMRLSDGSTAALPTWYWYGQGSISKHENVVDPAVVETLKDIRRQWNG